MRVLTLLSLAAVVMPFVVRTHISPLYVNLSDRGIFQGYWHNSCNEDVSYYGHSATAACIQLRNVDTIFNVIAVAYMQSVSEGSIPTFTINPETGMNERNFANQVFEIATRRHKTAVIISFGGPKSNISLISGQEDDLKNEFIRLAETYGFSGVEVNLERSVLDVADNVYVITTALRDVKSHFDHIQRLDPRQNPSFMIVMAAQVSFRCDDKYRPYLDGVVDYVDYITMKFFDYDRDDARMMANVNIDVFKGFASSRLAATKQRYLETLPHAYEVMNDCYEIPNHMLVHGTLVNNYAGGRRHSLLNRVLALLFTQSRKGKPMRGVALWSINWDQAKYSNGHRYAKVKRRGDRVGQFSTELFNVIQMYSLL